jgi:hypothetical protein
MPGNIFRVLKYGLQQQISSTELVAKMIHMNRDKVTAVSRNSV